MWNINNNIIITILQVIAEKLQCRYAIYCSLLKMIVKSNVQPGPSASILVKSHTLQSMNKAEEKRQNIATRCKILFKSRLNFAMYIFYS